ncbi:MAG: ABC transporter ATP-binding protein [Nitrospira sp.]|nr:ABC transporter ATP-binding protein [Nitrospira sp.]MBS0173665.1 ABC transporter ATP-binding protein [Nitrospira sp.]MBX3339436.1 ABC transporter ATP-binding protein [Nitrospira sp.]MCW5780175.1 ABC transporter ATP-binding protein [Nitrospira sp.]
MDDIVTDNLTKTYASGWPGRPAFVALDGLSLTVRRGEIFGFLGPNGAGKTTTLKILMGLVRATSGTALLLGQPAGDVETRRRIGFLPESPYFYDYLTAEEFLGFYGRLAGLSRAAITQRVTDLLELVGLVDARTRQLRKFSKGMLQRVGLAQALIHDPELIILDEPMTGLDPVGRKQVRDLILSLRDCGKTVCFSTHILHDVEMICDRVGIVMKGRLVASGRVDELVRQDHTRSVEVVCQQLKVEGNVFIHSLATRVLQQGQQCLIVLPSPDAVDALVGEIRRQGGRLLSVTPHKASLEDLFFQEASHEGTKMLPHMTSGRAS